MENHARARKPAGLAVWQGGEWPKSTLSVCWLSNSKQIPAFLVDDYGSDIDSLLEPAPEYFKDIVRNAVVREFTSDRTIIRFSGWQNCDSAPDADIKLAFSSYPEKKPHLLSMSAEKVATGGHSSNIGREHVDRGEEVDFQNPSPLYILFKFWTDPKLLNVSDVTVLPYATRDIEFMAVHEFGHMAGLMHEMDDTRPFLSGKMGRRVVPFDSESIMWLSQKPHLSDGDLTTLRSLYKK